MAAARDTTWLDRPARDGRVPLDQYGMEYNPVAINEVLAYSFLQYRRARRRDAAWQPVLHRAGEHADVAGDLGGDGRAGSTRCSTWAVSCTTSRTEPPARCWTRIPDGTWDIVFTADDPYSRPDPYRGQLVPLRQPLRGDAACAVELQPAARRAADRRQPEQPGVPPPSPPAGGTPAATATDGYDVMLHRLYQARGLHGSSCRTADRDIPASVPIPSPPRRC